MRTMTIIQLDKMLDTTCRKSGHSSALLNVNLTFQFVECIMMYDDSYGGERDRHSMSGND